jgi:Cu/Ag efflux pump CusA
LVVALTVTPVLCYFLLARSSVIREERDSRLVAWLKHRYTGILNWTLRRPYKIIGASVLMLGAAVAVIPFMGREFLPPFNEGTLNINANLPPGAPLKESNRVGNLIEMALREVPEVVSTTRRTGRAELDEHAAGVNTSELEVVTKEDGRSHAEVMEEARQKLATIPGVAVEVGQPISHRIDHLLSGTRAQIAIKLFGPELATLRTKANEIRIGQVAEVRTDQGPNTINRENAQRRIIIQSNVAGRDLGGVINDVRAAIRQKVALPQGYFVQYGGQFEAQEKASRQITLLSVPTLILCAQGGAMIAKRSSGSDV